MAEIKHNLLPVQKKRTYGLNATIDIYPIAQELIDELSKNDIMERLKEVPQLGVIKVNKKLKKSRYDYVMLQLYFHQLIKKNIQSSLKYTYNNFIKAKEFHQNLDFINEEFKPSLVDVMQVITVVYNIGHFYNTFTASRAVVLMANKDTTFAKILKKELQDERYKIVLNRLIEEKNYQRFHLINSLLILSKCNQDLLSVKFATELLYAYLDEDSLPSESKLIYAFDIFRKVRTISYMVYDLQIADTPLTIDIGNKVAMNSLLKEWLSEYNNTISSNHLMNSISKLLDDSVYNENSNAVCYYKISRRIVNELKKIEEFDAVDYYSELFISKTSLLNKTYSHRRDYYEKQILKLTFSREDRNLSFALLDDLERLNNTRVGYYDRYSGEQTIVVSIKKSCSYDQKRMAAFKVLKLAISSMRRSCSIKSTDSRYILCVKFFLYYLFIDRPVIIKPTLDEKKCVICTRGKNKRIQELKNLLELYEGSDDQRHESELMLKVLRLDSGNDTSLTVPASVLVYDSKSIGKKKAEFDGIIIYPFRKDNQIIFLEAKNIDHSYSKGKNALQKKIRHYWH